jgi:orotate phosphoribosyltransferase
VAFARARQLASLVTAADPLVLGFCETATGLGRAVAGALGSEVVCTTRRAVDAPLATFEEEHSHATAHYLPGPADLFADDRPLVLVDDELTTGTTALNTIAALPRRTSYVLASLIDLRSDQARAAFDERAAAMGVDVRVVALLDGVLHLPADVLERGAALRDELRGSLPSSPPRESNGRTLVLGTEECMDPANTLALELEEQGVDVVVQSTTRSPVLPCDEAPYAIRRALTFPSTEDNGRTAFVYNLERYDEIVVVTDCGADRAAPLAEKLTAWADRVTVQA